MRTAPSSVPSARRGSVKNIVGTSAKMNAIFQMIETVAEVQSTVLVTGESGTGKELVARAIHDLSPRAEKPFISINCGAFTETLLESELFGYVKGAFTGANTNRKGLFEAAHSGTIFLDEIGEMSPAMQVKLLRVLQERRVRPVGAHDELPIDARVIAATNRDLKQMSRGRNVSRRSFLSHLGHSDPSAAASRTGRRHSRSDRTFCQEILRSGRQRPYDLAKNGSDA